ncbi:unnamed protein product (macronuclear) [Paramecium tetraurelia]|uniref:F-box domain-containing protein n=1 Tax=Paramecium tetraurelia TaxID=5888 RepID=A0EF80_PARTE|nr:uncharacterized protein GSPATT00026294001 [Paramecium tetraurelia]CAK93971.1 unnamed protein product [Paramecium tetraurelia]|eukprot:XP_001461344.1 hypothetical protein (macronuclear) [Paramecium tetraurelia strain d4-2]
MLQNNKAIQPSKSNKNPPTKINQRNQQIVSKAQHSTPQSVTILQLEKPKTQKSCFEKYFNKPVIYNIILFLNCKDISSLRRVNSYFNQTFIECLPILKQFFNKQLDMKQQQLQSNIFYNQVPQLNDIDFEGFKHGLQNELMYACPEKVPQFYLKCIELISQLLLQELPKWRYSKYTYQMKTKLLYEKLEKKVPLINIYDLSDKQLEIIRSDAQNIMNTSHYLKWVFTPLVDFVDNLIIVTRSPHYAELKKFKQIQYRISEIQQFLNTYFKNE